MTEEQNKQKRGRGAPAGSKNAQKGDAPATAFLHMRIDPEMKERFSAAAEAAGMKLSTWIIEAGIAKEKEQNNTDN